MKNYIKNKGRYEEYVNVLEELRYFQHRIAERLSKMDTRQSRLYSLVEETLSLLEEIINDEDLHQK